MFDILTHGAPAVEIAGAAVLDVFAGSGALGLEALSRGAGHATFIDCDARAIALIRKNAATLGESQNATLISIDATRPPPPPRAAAAPVALVFLDPPYASGLAGPALAALSRRDWIAEGATCAVETGARDPFEAPRGFDVVDERVYGAARVVFLVFRGGSGAAVKP